MRRPRRPAHRASPCGTPSSSGSLRGRRPPRTCSVLLRRRHPRRAARPRWSPRWPHRSPRAARSVGVLMGTAYLFTDEAVAAGAIQPAFQDAALACERTVLLETVARPRDALRRDRLRATRSRDAKAAAARPRRRREGPAGPSSSSSTSAVCASPPRASRREGDRLVDVRRRRCQRRDGMFMIGAGRRPARRASPRSPALHDDVSGRRPPISSPSSRAARSASGDRSRAPTRSTSRSSAWPASSPARRTPTRSGPNIARRRERGHRGAGRALGRRTLLRRRRLRHATPAARPRRKWGGFLADDRRSTRSRTASRRRRSRRSSRCSCSASRSRRARSPTPATATAPFDRERARRSIFGAEAGTDLSGAYGFRALLPQLFGEPCRPSSTPSLPTLTEDSFPGVLTNVIAGRIANRLDLGGVNYTVDAACASSLAALDAACKELRRRHERPRARAAAPTCTTASTTTCCSHRARAVADRPVPHVRRAPPTASPSARASPAWCSSGCVDAERDGDRIYAVIKAVAGSSDGRSLGLTAPRKEGQHARARARLRAGRRARQPRSGSSRRTAPAPSSATAPSSPR